MSSESASSRAVPPVSRRAPVSGRAYVLAGAMLLPSVLLAGMYVRAAGSCRQYQETARYMQENYGSVPVSCARHFLQEVFPPAGGLALPGIFLAAVLFSQEKRRAVRLDRTRQEAIAFWLALSSILLALGFIVVVKTTRCEGFGCLGLGPLIAVGVGVFPPLILGASLWFLAARYRWKERGLLKTALVLLTLVGLAGTLIFG